MLFYSKIRQVISHHIALQAAELFDGAVELDARYFGGARKGKRGRGAAGKVAVFGILKRGGKIYTKVVNDTISEALMPLIARKIAHVNVVYSDCYRSYNALDVSGIENFWNQAKRVLRKCSEIPKQSFPLFLKECKFRFNHRTPKQQLKILKERSDV